MMTVIFFNPKCLNVDLIKGLKMKINRDIKLKFLALALVLFSSKSFAANPTEILHLTFLPESRIELKGDSTFRKFGAVARDLKLTGDVQDRATASKLPWTPVYFKMILPVKNLKSGEETLDEHMHENLKADKFPEIQLKLSGFIFSGSGADSVVTATGELTVAGVSKPVELKATLSSEGQNIRIKGTKQVLMSDFGIEPPTMMLGTIQTRNEIEISFDVICTLIKKEKG
jgi:hypothetical protein